MSRYEKTSWYNLAVVGAAVVAFAAFIPFWGWTHALGAFGLLGFLGLAPMITRGRKANATVIADERDQLIKSQAGLIAYWVFWLAFVSASMGLWAFFQSQGSIPVNILPLFPLVGGVLMTLVQSLVTVIQYQRGK